MSHPQSHDLVCRHFCNVFSLKFDLSGLRCDETGHSMKDRCFSCSVGADQGNDLSLIDFEGNALDGLDHAVIYF